MAIPTKTPPHIDLYKWVGQVNQWKVLLNIGPKGHLKKWKEVGKA
jgi:hypothetical protein